MTLKPEDEALIKRVLPPIAHGWAQEHGKALARLLAAAREEARPNPRPSPVGREEVARWICRTVRIAQGFKGTAEYTLDDEVHNAWDDWLDEADDLLALFFPADGWRPIEPRLRRFVDPFRGHEFYFDPSATAMIKNAHGQATFVMRDGSHYSTTTSYEEALRMVGAAAPPPPGGQG